MKGKKGSANEKKIKLKDLLIFRLKKLQMQRGELLKQRLLQNGKLSGSRKRLRRSGKRLNVANFFLRNYFLGSVP